MIVYTYINISPRITLDNMNYKINTHVL